MHRRISLRISVKIFYQTGNWFELIPQHCDSFPFPSRPPPPPPPPLHRTFQIFVNFARPSPVPPLPSASVVSLFARLVCSSLHRKNSSGTEASPGAAQDYHSLWSSSLFLVYLKNCFYCLMKKYLTWVIQVNLLTVANLTHLECRGVGIEHKKQTYIYFLEVVTIIN